MFNRFRLPGLLPGLLLALLASTGTAWAQTTNQNQSIPPATVTVQVPTTATDTSTTIKLHIDIDTDNQRTTIQVASNANPSAPAIVAASVGSNSVATVPVDVSDPFVWAVSPDPTGPGCGPHPPVAMPGCAHAETAPTLAWGGNVRLGPDALSAISADSSVEVAALQAVPPTPSAEITSTSAPVLQYTVQPGDTLAVVARRFYGVDANALDQVVQRNLGQAMPDGRTFADSNQIWPGWVLTLPLPSRVAYDQDGQRWYIVQSGDTLSTIAARLLGSPSRWSELYALNQDRIEAPDRIRTGAKLHLPVSQPATLSAEPGQDDGPVQSQQNASAWRQEMVGVTPPGAPASGITPTRAAPLRSTPKSAMADSLTPESILPAGPAPNPGVTSLSASDPNRVALPDGEYQDPLLPPDSAHLVSTATAVFATLLSISLGVWFIRRLLRARFQPRLLPLAINSSDQLFSTALSATRPPKHLSASSETDRRAQCRALVLQRVLDGTLASEAAATQLELSTRQLRRLLAAYRTGGVDALRHANAGRVPVHAVPDQVRDHIIELVRTRYAGLSQSELTQRLATEHGIQLHRTTVRRILHVANQEATEAARRSTEPQTVCDGGLPRAWPGRAVQEQAADHRAVIWGSW